MERKWWIVYGLLLLGLVSQIALAEARENKLSPKAAEGFLLDYLDPGIFEELEITRRHPQATDGGAAEDAALVEAAGWLRQLLNIRLGYAGSGLVLARKQGRRGWQSRYYQYSAGLAGTIGPLALKDLLRRVYEEVDAERPRSSYNRSSGDAELALEVRVYSSSRRAWLRDEAGFIARLHADYLE